MAAGRSEGTEDERDSRSQRLAAFDGSAATAVSHNLNGQKLGRKGRVTRERILAAAADLIEEAGEDQVTLSAIARRASLGMSSLYNYFSDLTEVVLAVLDPVMTAGREEFEALLEDYWPDDVLPQRCQAFVAAYHRFWSRYSGLLHLRNSMADQFDLRMMRERVASTSPLIGMLERQMDRNATNGADVQSMATVLMTGIERSITLATDRRLHRMVGFGAQRDQVDVRNSVARLMELGIRDMRAQA
ncbi:hypothetical protein B2G71_15470 [Novosphingobium sp. PC22D]|nr:hypothetical protein B2G71_15470 [Novosphingobium sp. PC22D]